MPTNIENAQIVGVTILELRENPSGSRRKSARIWRLGLTALYEWAYR